MIREFVPLKAYVLNVGAGTSRMTEEMNVDGYLTLLNIDISGTAVLSHLSVSIFPTSSLCIHSTHPLKDEAHDGALQGSIRTLGLQGSRWLSAPLCTA